MLKKLFELPDLVTLSGQSLTSENAISSDDWGRAPNACSQGCQSGCPSGCGTGSNPGTAS